MGLSNDRSLAALSLFPPFPRGRVLFNRSSAIAINRVLITHRDESAGRLSVQQDVRSLLSVREYQPHLREVDSVKRLIM